MKLDNHSLPYFDHRDLMSAIYAGIDISSLKFSCEDTEEIRLHNSAPFELGYSELLVHEHSDISTTEIDKELQSQWFMPDQYLQMDIVEWLVEQCRPDDVYNARLAEELSEFISRDWLNLLRWLKYFVDTCRENSIVWGVGRGSSVSSYVLFLIGVHKIDPVLYDLDWKEFL